MKINFYQLKKRVNKFRSKRPDKPIVNFVLINSLIILIEFLYLTLRYSYINSMVPFFYSKNWGEYQLAPKSYLFYIPLISALTVPIGIWFYHVSKKFYFSYSKEVVTTVITISNFVLSISLLRIIFIASKPFEPLLDPLTFNMSLLFISMFLITNILMPFFISLMKNLKIVTYPQLHNHPGMSLKKPSARGGGVLFGVVILFAALFLQLVNEELFPIFIGVTLLSLLAILDDYQNTHIRSRLRVLEKPILRLMIIFLLVAGISFMGVQINQFGNPFGGMITLDQFTLTLGSTVIAPLAILVTTLWIVWVLNIMSWSNGVDGQYGGTIGISFLILALLALRFEEILPVHELVAEISVAAAAISFSITRFNWYPSKIMWGFGATVAAFLLTALSIIIGAKVGVTMMIILVPFLDGIVTFMRRLLQGRSPFKGDRGHLHHLLNKKGWGVRRISVFYWFTTLIFGLLVVFTAEKSLYIVTITSMLLVAILIVSLSYSTDPSIQTKLKGIFSKK